MLCEWNRPGPLKAAEAKPSGKALCFSLVDLYTRLDTHVFALVSEHAPTPALVILKSILEVRILVKICDSQSASEGLRVCELR